MAVLIEKKDGNEPVKRPRGRPRKVEDPSIKKEVKKRGRPRGSKNKTVKYQTGAIVRDIAKIVSTKVKHERGSQERYGPIYPVVARAREGLIKLFPAIMKDAEEGDKDARNLIAKLANVNVKPVEEGTGFNMTKRREILEQYERGELTLISCAIAFEKEMIPLPEAIKTMLLKAEQPTDDPTAGVYSVLSNEQIEQQRRELEAKILAQKEGLPERREEIHKLHSMVADTFGPEKVQ